MASTGPVLLQLLLLVSLASASHYFGGTTSFSYKGKNPDGSFKLAVRHRATFDGCSTLSWACASGNCGSVSKTQNYVTDQSSNSPQSTRQWCETETVETRRVTSDRPFQIRASSCCWISTRNSVSNWRLNSLVDLGVRSDTREPNRAPDVAILPFMRVPQNCPRTYKLASFDPDGDRVRCRYGSVTNVECDKCITPSGFHLDQDSCTLHYRSISAHSFAYGFEMVIEDFSRGHINLRYSDGSQSHRHPLLARKKRQAPQSTTPDATTFWQMTRQPYTNTPPLSKRPLQFSVLVDPSAPSCQEGAYLPKFVHPTPENGAHMSAEVNKELEIRIRAQATHSVIKDLILSGPTNITMHKNTHDEFVIRWTPVPDDFGDHFPICFAVESATGSALSNYQNASQSQSQSHSHNHSHAAPLSQSGMYQSEMRCVVVDVGKEQIQATVTCSETTMTVEIDKSSFYGLQEDHVRLSDPTNTACSLERYSNSTHIVAVIPLNACGTQIEEDDDYLYFKNEITTEEEDEVLITRRHLVEARFYCQYPKKGNVTLGFTAHRKNVTVWERGFGTFTYQMEFYPDSQFGEMSDPNSYPLEYDIGDRIYMQIDASSSINNTQMFVESCRAAPYDNPNYHPTYSIIENGCTMDPTVQIHAPSEGNQFRFSMEAFKFIGLHDQVYISCSVMMCEAGNPNTRCSQGCMNSTRSGGHMHNHRKREAVIQSATHFISQGPLRLRRAADSRIGGPAINLDLNLVFIAGCLLAAVGMVCGVVLYKTKTSRVKYQPLPSCES